jgi:hypothetical protein
MAKHFTHLGMVGICGVEMVQCYNIGWPFVNWQYFGIYFWKVGG